MKPYPNTPDSADDYAASRALFEQITTQLSDPQKVGCTAEDIEEYLDARGNDLKRQLLQDKLDAQAAKEVRLPQVVGADDVSRTWAEHGRCRLLATLFGRVEVNRIAYRSAGVANLYPADAALALPEHLYSYPLCKRAVQRVTGGSVRAAQCGLGGGCGQVPGTRQLMEIMVESATDVRDFYQMLEQPGTITPCDDLLVLSVDATGVNMIPADLRQPADRASARRPRPPSASLSRRERTGRSRMAVVTVLYDAAPAVRTPADIVALDAAERAGRRPGPKSRNRRVNASVTHSTDPMVRQLFQQAQSRDPEHRRRWVVVVDGANHQLECLKKHAKAMKAPITIIIDFIHVLEYVWKAAEDLHPTYPARVGFVQRTARDLLGGNINQVMTDLENRLRAQTEAGQNCPGLKRAVDYLRAKRPYLGYDMALALGWPIASGLVEGACRSIVKDRLDITGARWSLRGAEAVLLLRTVITNGDFEEYWTFHTRQDYQRVHATRYKDQLTLAA
jgi:hypothetical protein